MARASRPCVWRASRPRWVAASSGSSFIRRRQINRDGDGSPRLKEDVGAMINLAAMATADPAFDFFPRESGGGVLHQVGLSPFQFLFLPVMDRYGLGGRRQIIPQVLYELEFLRRTQIKDGSRCSAASLSNIHVAGLFLRRLHLPLQVGGEHVPQARVRFD